MDKQEMNDFIVSSWKQGKSYAEIGRNLGITREAVRQKANKIGLSYEIPKMWEYMNVPEAAKYFNVTPSCIGYSIKLNKLKAIKIGCRNYIPRQNPLIRKCEICNAEVPLSRTVYCSNECYKKGAYKSFVRGSFRRLKIKMGQKLTPSIELRICKKK